MNRMNREQFFARLAPFDEERLRKALWNLYWRGNAAVRERIEAELEPDQVAVRRQRAPGAPDPERVRGEVREFVALARSGAYLGGDRRVSPKERTRWRFTFKRLVAEAGDALRAEEPAPAAAAMEAIIDLACELRRYDYFRPEDPIESAKVVISDEVSRLWGRLLEHAGFPAFAEQAAAQLIRWESRYGWTRSGWGSTSQRESSLASVLVPMLRIRDAWMTFTDRYLEALDQFAPAVPPRPRRPWDLDGPAQERGDRTANLAEWHGLLLDRFADDDEDGRLDRLTTHPALGGPELTFLQAQLAHRRGDTDRAHRLVRESLERLPGHQGFLDFAAGTGAPIPPRAQAAVARGT